MNAPLPSTQDRLRGLLQSLSAGLIERDPALRLVLLAALAGEHILLLGPPGTAKSEIARRLHRALRDGAWFERLLTRFSVPEELFGPLSLKALEDDRYHRLTAAYLPGASVAFLDEVFKANSAILNALLTLLNERLFDNGEQRVRTPLVSVVAASNELPEGEELGALYDRFLLRLHLDPVSDEGFVGLLDGEPQPPQVEPAAQLRAEELEGFRTKSRGVRISAAVRDVLSGLRQHCREQSIRVSDRRWRKAAGLLRVAAFTDGRDEVSLWDVFLLEHCLWEKPEQRAVLRQWLDARIGTTEVTPQRLHQLVATWEETAARENDQRDPVKDKEGKVLYYADAPGTKADKRPQSTSPTVPVQKKNAQGEPLYLWPQNNRDRTNGGAGHTAQEIRQNNGHYFRVDEQYFADRNNFLTEQVSAELVTKPRRYSPAHVEGRLRAVDEVLRELTQHVEGLTKHLAEVDRAVGRHLWLDPALLPIARRGLETAKAEAATLTKRLKATRDRFETLPRSEL